MKFRLVIRTDSTFLGIIQWILTRTYITTSVRWPCNLNLNL